MHASLQLFPFVDGIGSDEVGAFNWRSTRSKQGTNPDKVIRFVKEYQRHDVHYMGIFQGGLLFGRWALGSNVWPVNEEGGTFALWPANYEELLTKKLDYIDQPTPIDITGKVVTFEYDEPETVEFKFVQETFKPKLGCSHSFPFPKNESGVKS